MIRKPDARDFRESDTVLALRDAGTLARAGARSMGENAARRSGGAVGALFGLMLLISIGLHLGSFSVLIGTATAITMVALARGKRDRADRWNEAEDGQAAALGHYTLDVPALGRAAAATAVPAILFFPTRNVALMSGTLPFMVSAAASVSIAMLTVLRLFGDRTLVRWDGESVTVRGLIGDATMLWADVDDIAVERTHPANLSVLFASGSRRNLVIRGARNRMGGAARLYVPVNIIDLAGDTPAMLVTRLLAARAGQVAAPRPPAPASSPASTPAAVPARAATPAFDPDAIIARYMAERDGRLATAEPDVPLPAPRTFGRKRIA